MATKCPKCQSENPPGTIYCGQCATKLAAATVPPPSFTMTLETPVDDLQADLSAGK